MSLRARIKQPRLSFLSNSLNTSNSSTHTAATYIQYPTLTNQQMKPMALLKLRHTALLILSCFVLISCSGTPAGVTPVANFDAQRYLGKWYEIARLDHSFERDMQSVTANYSMNKDGSIKVLNRGFNTKDKEWSEAKGKAKFVDASDTGHLKVSFFGPFYGSYIVAELAEDYSYSLVTGPNTDYLWILSRTPTLDQAIYASLIQKAERLGFATQGLIKVGHSVPE